ncbi:hypothetical protein WDU94_013221 [Cyamophila willieti]
MMDYSSNLVSLLLFLLSLKFSTNVCFACSGCNDTVMTKPFRMRRLAVLPKRYTEQPPRRHQSLDLSKDFNHIDEDNIDESLVDTDRLKEWNDDILFQNREKRNSLTRLRSKIIKPGELDTIESGDETLRDQISAVNNIGGLEDSWKFISNAEIPRFKANDNLWHNFEHVQDAVITKNNTLVTNASDTGNQTLAESSIPLQNTMIRIPRETFPKTQTDIILRNSSEQSLTNSVESIENKQVNDVHSMVKEFNLVENVDKRNEYKTNETGAEAVREVDMNALFLDNISESSGNLSISKYSSGPQNEVFNPNFLDNMTESSGNLITLMNSSSTLNEAFSPNLLDNMTESSGNSITSQNSSSTLNEAFNPNFLDNMTESSGNHITLMNSSSTLNDAFSPNLLDNMTESSGNSITSQNSSSTLNEAFSPNFLDNMTESSANLSTTYEVFSVHNTIENTEPMNNTVESASETESKSNIITTYSVGSNNESEYFHLANNATEIPLRTNKTVELLRIHINRNQSKGLTSNETEGIANKSRPANLQLENYVHTQAIKNRQSFELSNEPSGLHPTPTDNSIWTSVKLAMNGFIIQVVDMIKDFTRKSLYSTTKILKKAGEATSDFLSGVGDQVRNCETVNRTLSNINAIQNTDMNFIKNTSDKIVNFNFDLMKNVSDKVLEYNERLYDNITTKLSNHSDENFPVASTLNKLKTVYGDSFG